MKLALGTVQFGLDYGVANAGGKVSPGEVAAILALARSHGIDTLDTAAAYGDSEAVLGQANVEGWHVISKLPPEMPGTTAAGDWVLQSVGRSLGRLRQEKLHGVLLHRPAQLLAPDGEAVHRALQRLKSEGIVARIGISVYGPQELEALSGRFDFDLVQAPLSVVDRRIIASGWAARLAAAGVELHARSAFLQGLLLMRRDERPARFARWASVWREWQAWLDQEGLPASEACIRYAMSREGVGKLVVGVQSCSQLAEVIAAAAKGPLEVPAHLAVDSEDLLNPARWPSLG